MSSSGEASSATAHADIVPHRRSQRVESRGNAESRPSSSHVPTVTPAQRAVGHFSFAPATKTTVVTTTTTTTTAFPPFVMQAPKNLADRDPERFPLAAKSTPHSLKRLRFNLGGQRVVFEEASDPGVFLDKYDQEQRSLRRHDGTIERITTSPDLQNQRSIQPQNLKKGATRPEKTPRRVTEHLVNGVSNTPVSTPTATESQTSQIYNFSPQRRSSHPRALRRHVPQTPKHESDSDSESWHDPPVNPLTSESAELVSIVKDSKVSKGTQDVSEPPTDLPRLDTSDGLEESEVRSTTTLQAAFTPRSPRNNGSNPAFPRNIDTSVTQGVSLPSPSLSPITAAANLQNGPSKNLSSVLQRSLRRSQAKHRPPKVDQSRIPQSSPLDPVDKKDDSEDELARSPSNPDIPEMLDSFDQLPDDLKTYVMYQMLRRSSKPTLRFVADTVNPTLRVDFIGRLPLELSLCVMKHLDARTMCAAAQVSKKWRLIVDSNEVAWKNLLEVDGFQVSTAEIEQAIRSGWGWQYPWSSQDETDGPWRQNVNRPDQFLESSDRRFSEAGIALFNSVNAVTNDKKRKGSQSSASNKRQKRQNLGPSRPMTSNWMHDLEATHGPNAYAAAAAMAVPNPQIGLPQLANMHLFKSIYCKNHMMRSSWMQPDFKPVHVAFRAHQRHVVTCLRFDSEKIITGSDDSNIDMYDINTGSSVRRLQGHDGGVWALEYYGDLLVSGSTDRTIRVWDMRTGEMKHVFQGHTSTVRCLQILQPTQVGEVDGKPIMKPKQPLIITGSRDSTCKIWKMPNINDPPIQHSGSSLAVNDSENPYFVRTLNGHMHSVRAIAAHADTLVSGSYDSVVRVWKISNGECVHRLHGHTSKVYSVVLDYDRGRCISGSMDYMVKVWSLEMGHCLFNLDGHTSLVGLLDLKDDCLVSAAADATLRIWDPETGYCKHTLEAHTGAITCFLHDKQKIISGSDRTLKMWNTQTGEFVRDLLSDLTGVWQIKFDDRRCVAAVQREDWVYIEVLDFGPSREGVHSKEPGRRIVVDRTGHEVVDNDDDDDEEAESDLSDSDYLDSNV